VTAVKILPDVYWVGVIDWDARYFHGHTYTTQRGTTYNAYLIIDEKVALIDTVYGPFAGELAEKIKQVIEPARIDYIVANHVEMDHSGALPQILKICPQAKVFGTEKCRQGLYRHFYRDWDFQAVKTGDKLKLGKRTLTFIEAPMLHWPDSMFSYLIEDGLLLPNDAFGQHYATSSRFDDEVDDSVLMDEAAKYYASILWPFSSLVLNKIAEIQSLDIPIKMIAPSHGVIWRKDPAKIVKAYLSWARHETRPKVVVVYETMWGATRQMARKIAEGIIEAGLDLRLFDVICSDRTEIIKEMLDAKGFVIGSSTHDNDMLPTIAGFLEFLKGLRPKDKVACVFGSYGWTGQGVNSIERALKIAGIEVIKEPLSIRYMPCEADLKHCYEYGVSFAEQIKKRGGQ
jgi:flavorubredoxin